jgi:hypothetical protein
MNEAFSKPETSIKDVGIVYMICPSQSYQTVHEEFYAAVEKPYFNIRLAS